MREPTDHDDFAARDDESRYRLRERQLEEDGARLSEHLLDTAESVRRSHEQVADAMERGRSGASRRGDAPPS